MQGSVINRLMEGSKQPIPEVGMAATICLWSDRYAGTVASVSRTGHQVAVRRDKATLVAGNMMSEGQEYRYEADPEGALYVFSRRKDGSYREVRGTKGLLLGQREEYRDPHF